MKFTETTKLGASTRKMKEDNFAIVFLNLNLVWLTNIIFKW